MEQESLLQQIKLLSDSIRVKNQALKLGLSEKDRFLQRTFNPIVQPLKDISEKLTKSEKTEDKTFDYNKLNEEESVSNKLNDDESLNYTTSDLNDSMSETSSSEDIENIPPKESGSNLSMIGDDLAEKGLLTRKYLLKFMKDNPGSNRNFHVYGARLENNGIMMGDSLINIDNNDNINVGSRTYKGTRGLFELLFKARPENYTKSDLANFQMMCKDTNSHRKNYLKTNSIYRNTSSKYRTVIKELFPPKTISKRGSGMEYKNANASNIIYYNDVNELIDRAKFIYTAIQNGHTGLENEWLSIIEVLKKQNIIF